MPIPTPRIPGRLEHLGFDAGMQGKRGSHPVTDNQDLHRFTFMNAVSDGRYLDISGGGDQMSSSAMWRAWITSRVAMINRPRESCQAAWST
jgi:hypothetical protein